MRLNPTIFDVMNVPLICHNVKSFLYPSKEQIDIWRKLHKKKVEIMLGKQESIEPLCYICRVFQNEKIKRTVVQQWNRRRNNLILFVKFHKYMRRLRSYLLRSHEKCEHIR